MGKTLLLTALALCALAADGDLARRRPGAHTRWASFENPKAVKGAGGKENKGAKGHAFDSLKPGETKPLLDVRGSGEVRRIWITVSDRDPQTLRSLRLEAFWDGSGEPAVSVPLGDFFGAILGRTVAFESELFANPEGRSFVCYVPMPFRKGARITITNDSARHLPHLFYDVDVLLTDRADPELLYFHAAWRRVRWNQPGQDFEILPFIQGEGRFLGAHVGVIAHPDNVGWWGEGEVKMYVDGDNELPTIVGTGTEDYIGTGWGQGVFHNRYQGSLIVDAAKGQYGFYRYHVPDPVYFHQDLRVTIQVMGGASKAEIVALMKKGVPVDPVSVDDAGKFTRLKDNPADLSTFSDKAWVNVYRRDDWSAVALFYLDKPASGLLRIAPVAARVEGLN
jgi:hypothetical protein